MRNIYRGIRVGSTVCPKCGAEWDTREPGQVCGAGYSKNQDFKAPFATCDGILKDKQTATQAAA